MIAAQQRAALPHIPPLHYPGQSLSVALYLHGGIGGREIGQVMFGRQPDGSETETPPDLVRLAIPRRVYTQSHMDYVVEAILEVFERRDELKGLKITRQAPALRHFTAKFAWLD
jgi:tryptophanase